MKRRSGITSLFKNHDFLKLWIGQIISYLGDRVAQMALLGWLILSHQETGSEMSKITFLIIFPSFLFGQFAGALSDKFPRKWVMVSSDFTRAILVFLHALLIYKTASSPYWIYAIIFMVGTCSAFFYPAKLAAIPSLVKAEELQAANAVTSGSGVIATLIGTYFAGILIESWGPRIGLLINSATYIISGLAILWICPTLSPDFSSQVSESTLVFDCKSVWQYLKNHKRAWRWMLLSCVLSLLSSFFYISLTVLAVDYFKLGTEGVGRLLTMLGVGMIAGSFAAIWLKKWLKTNALIILAFLIIFLTTATVPMVTSFSKAWVWLILLGSSNAVILITVDTLLQRATPNRFRGKVFGFRSVLTNGVSLLSLLAVSQLLKIASPFIVFKILSFVSLSLAFLILLIDTSFSYQVGRFLIRMFLRLFFSFEVEGEEHLKYQSKVIVAGNHTGFLDIPILVAAFNRPIRFLAAQGVLSWPVIGWIVRLVGVIPVVKGRGDKNLAVAIEELKRGKVVGIFPEGELSRDGRIGLFRRGVARLQTESHAPIVPFVIQGGYEAWPWGRWFPKPRKLILQFGQPIPRQDKDEKELVKDIQHRIEFMKSALERREQAKKDRIYQESVLSLLQSKSDVYGARTALFLKEEFHWKELTYSELSRKARLLASHLIERGIQQGDRVAILSESRPEWGIALFGVIRAGAIFVPLDIKLTQ
ncbi:MAG: MFS transporter [Candidatus Omnitrophica bacterium]|nr:MFS transporter [Candidatus Omnitrophota bacterium]